MRPLQIARQLWQNRADRYLVLALVGFFVTGLLIGWLWLGWIVAPVVYVPGGPGTMSIEEQAEYVELVAELYSYKLDGSQAQIVLADWGGDVLACRMAAVTDDDVRRIRYLALVWAVNGRGCE
jgi:hypothetical protein